MKLNMAILKEDLAKWNLKGKLREPPYALTFAYAQMCNTCPDDPAGDVLYILAGALLPERMPKYSRRPSFLCVGKPPEDWLTGKAELLYTCEAEAAVGVLLNEVNRLFYTYAKWEANLQEVLDQRIPLREMAKRSLPVFHNGNPIVAVGSAFNILFWVLPEVKEPTPAYKTYLQDWDVTESSIKPDEMAQLLADPEYEHTSEATAPTLFSGKKFNTPKVIFYNIVIGGVYVARLLMDELQQPFTGRDYALLGVLGVYLKKGLAISGAYAFERPRDMEQVMTSLLMRRPIADERIRDLLGIFRWQEDDEYFCISLKLRFAEKETAALYPIAAHLAAHIQNEFYVVYGDSLIFVHNLTRIGLTRQQLLEKMLPVFRDELLEAGISTVYRDFRQLPYYYRQAETARRLGNTVTPTYWYFRYEDYQLEDILERCLQDTVPDTLIPDGLKRLQDYDKKKGTDYLRLLKVYLETERNIAETIRITYMHRNTFLYRMNKIENILGMELDDPGVRFILSLAFWLLEKETPG